MYIKFWGTRGSLPRAAACVELLEYFEDLAQTAKKDHSITTLDAFLTAARNQKFGRLSYGGNTACTEIGHDNRSIFVDSGTGIVAAGDEAIQNGIKEFVIFQTHLHWDHIMGLPFFAPIYSSGVKITIYHVHKKAPEYTKIQFNGVNFPLKWSKIQAKVKFVCLKPYEEVTIGSMKVAPFRLDHPGGCYGYRVKAGGKSVAVGVDSEYKRVTPKDLKKDLSYYQNLDMLVFDGQFEMNELAKHYDWGHSSPVIGVDLALREGIRNLAVVHHDPRSSPRKIVHMIEHAKTHLKHNLSIYKTKWSGLHQPDGPNVFAAYDGLRIDL